MDDIYQQLNSGNIVIGIFLDLQKAFDTVDHSILLAKLYNYGLCWNVYNWFKDYLYDSQQFVSIRGIDSDTAFVFCLLMIQIYLLVVSLLMKYLLMLIYV